MHDSLHVYGAVVDEWCKWCVRTEWAFPRHCFASFLGRRRGSRRVHCSHRSLRFSYLPGAIMNGWPRSFDAIYTPANVWHKPQPLQRGHCCLTARLVSRCCQFCHIWGTFLMFPGFGCTKASPGGPDRDAGDTQFHPAGRIYCPRLELISNSSGLGHHQTV